MIGFGAGKVLQVGEVSVVKVRKLADGGQAKVYLCKDYRTGAKCVLKKSAPVTQAQMDAAQREVSLVRQMKHANVVGYIADDIAECVKNEKRSFVVLLLMEYCPGGSLLEYASKRQAEGKPFEEAEMVRMLVQMARAVEYLHRHAPPVAHRDIKLENFLLGASGRLVLCDFGSCVAGATRCESREDRLEQIEIIEKTTTPLYRAPEMCELFEGKAISEKVDVWALGCVLFALAFGKHAFEEGGTLGILSGRAAFPEEHVFSDNLVLLIKWLLTVHPDQRPRVGDVVDFAEQLAGCRKGPPARDRGSGDGARPRKQLLRVESWKLDNAAAAAKQAAEDPASALADKGQETLNVSNKSKKVSEMARRRLAKRNAQPSAARGEEAKPEPTSVAKTAPTSETGASSALGMLSTAEQSAKQPAPAAADAGTWGSSFCAQSAPGPPFQTDFDPFASPARSSYAATNDGYVAQDSSFAATSSAAAAANGQWGGEASHGASQSAWAPFGFQDDAAPSTLPPSSVRYPPGGLHQWPQGPQQGSGALPPPLDIAMPVHNPSDSAFDGCAVSPSLVVQPVALSPTFSPQEDSVPLQFGSFSSTGSANCDTWAPTGNQYAFPNDPPAQYPQLQHQPAFQQERVDWTEARASLPISPFSPAAHQQAL